MKNHPRKDGPVVVLVMIVCILWMLCCVVFWCVFRRPDPVSLDTLPIPVECQTNWAIPDLNLLHKDTPTPAEQAVIDETLQGWNRITNR